MWPIAHPVHVLQRLEIKTTFGQVVLDQDESPADATGFGKQFRNPLRIARVVQHIHKHAHVERRGRMWNCSSVEGRAFNQTRWPWGKFNSANSYRGGFVSNQVRDGAVTAPNV